MVQSVVSRLVGCALVDWIGPVPVYAGTRQGTGDLLGPAGVDDHPGHVLHRSRVLNAGTTVDHETFYTDRIPAVFPAVVRRMASVFEKSVCKSQVDSTDRICGICILLWCRFLEDIPVSVFGTALQECD